MREARRIARELSALTPDSVVLPGDPGADPVQVSVFAPPVAEAGTALLVQVFAHVVERADEARALALEFDVDAGRRGRRTLHVPVVRGSSLVFELRMGSLRVLEPVQRLVWRGSTEGVGFAVAVPAGTAPGTTLGMLSVRCAGVPVGDVTFKLQIGSTTMTSLAVAVGDGQRYETAFLSYASPDRAKVLDAAKVIRALGMDFFQDMLSIEPGERWERRLYAELDTCDVLLLFWSRAAKDSPWVRKEVDYALRRSGGKDGSPPAIRPIFIEGPPPEPPWSDLERQLLKLQWDDPLLYMPR